ncbi:MAG: FkbM family methyltransferase [Dongiaceae bacterium]
MSKSYAQFIAHLNRALTLPLKKWRRESVYRHLRDHHLTIDRFDTPHGAFAMYATGADSMWIAREYDLYEIDTKAWIDSFPPNAVFWDIGAHVGMIALYAGKRGLRTIAFEPAAQSYALLMRNIELNRLDDKIEAYPIAIGAKKECARMYMAQTSPGSVHHAVGQTKDSLGQEIKVAFRQPVVTYNLDAAVQELKLPAPHYLKIDVDSIEEKILDGAPILLADPALKEIMIECAEREARTTESIIAKLDAAGFKVINRDLLRQRLITNLHFVRK